jgi:hypothetical protein
MRRSPEPFEVTGLSRVRIPPSLPFQADLGGKARSDPLAASPSSGETTGGISIDLPPCAHDERWSSHSTCRSHETHRRGPGPPGRHFARNRERGHRPVLAGRGSGTGRDELLDMARRGPRAASPGRRPRSSQFACLPTSGSAFGMVLSSNLRTPPFVRRFLMFASLEASPERFRPRSGSGCCRRERDRRLAPSGSSWAQHRGALARRRDRRAATLVAVRALATRSCCGARGARASVPQHR